MRIHRQLIGIISLLMSLNALPVGGLQASKKPQAPAIVGIVTRMRGSAQVQFGNKIQPAQLGDDVRTGQIIVVGKSADSSVVLHWHNHGPRFQLNSGTTAKVTATGLMAISGPQPVKLNKGVTTMPPTGKGKPPKENSGNFGSIAYSPKRRKLPKEKLLTGATTKTQSKSKKSPRDGGNLGTTNHIR
jgi:hypothetical protein